MCGIAAAAGGTPSSQVASTNGGGLGSVPPPLPPTATAAPISAGTGYDSAPLAALAQGVDALSQAVARLAGAAGAPTAAPSNAAPGDGLRRFVQQDSLALETMHAHADANARANGGTYSPPDLAAIQQRTHELDDAAGLAAFFDAHQKGVTADTDHMTNAALAHAQQSGGTFIPEELAQIRATVLANEQGR